MSDNKGKKNDRKDKKNNPFGDFFPKGSDGNSPNIKILRNVFMWIILFGIVITIYMMMYGKHKNEWPVSYTEYVKLLEGDKIAEAVITKTQFNDFEFHGVLKNTASLEIDGQLRNVNYFYTKLGVLDSETEQLWRSKNILWSYEKGDGSWWSDLIFILPWFIGIGILIMFMRRMQGGGGGSKGVFSFGKARVKLQNESQEQVTFKDVAGADEAKYELEEIIEFLKAPEKFQKLGGKIPRGVLLLGPPGTGKTLLARAVAGEADVPFFTMSGADFVEMFVGVGASRVRDLFDQAKKNSPCLVFIDEMDAVGRQRGAGLGGGHDEREQTLNALLVEMDGFEQNSGVIIIAATNRPDVLDPALIRPGRFDRQVVVDRPDVRGREGIFEVHTKKIPLSDDVDLAVLARGTPGFSGADIANIVNESALLAARRESDAVTMYDFEKAKDKIMMGIERKSMVISDKEKEMTAYHEMGHALAGKFLPESDPVHKVTIIPRGRALGVTSYLPLEEYHSYSKEYVETKIIVLLSGRAAEKIIFNKISTGASNDLEQATNLAKKMVCDWGMSDKVGPMKLANKQDEVFLGRDISQPSDHSQATAELIDSEVQSLLMNASQKAEDLLNENIELLRSSSKILIERETIDGKELDIIANGEELPSVSLQKLEALKSIKIDKLADDSSEDSTDDEELDEEGLATAGA